MSTLRLNHVSASPWGNVLLDDLTIALQGGEILAIAGPNGAGKSSMLKLIAGDIRSSSGELILGDRPLQDWTAQQRATRLAFLPQLSLLNFPYSVEEVVLLGRTPHDSGRVRDGEILDQVLQLTDMTALRYRLYTQLSGGEKQRAQLARVFAQVWDDESLAGRLLLLDEPTSALDLAHQQQTLGVVRMLADRGCAIILVIHDLNLAATIANRVLVLQEGRQVALGPPKQVFTTEMFQRVFNVEVNIGSHSPENIPLIIPTQPQLR